jgi:hypothetical protein
MTAAAQVRVSRTSLVVLSGRTVDIVEKSRYELGFKRMMAAN